MKLLTLYNRRVSIAYKHSICSFAAIFVGITTIFTIVIPFYITFAINYDLWYQPKIFYEQPNVKFPYKYILLAEHNTINVNDTNSTLIDTEKLIAWSSFDWFNQITDNWHTSLSIKVYHYN